MHETRLQEQLKKIIIEELNLEEIDALDIHDDDPLFGDEGLGLDSLDAVELVVLIQKHFGVEIKDMEEVVTKTVRCRTIGDVSCTGLTLSTAENLEEIIREIAATRVTERGGRADDKRSESAMEDRKREGYF